MAKKCNRCSEYKDLTSFGKDPRNSTGYQGICNECKQRANRLLREKRATTQDYRPFAPKNCSQCGELKSDENEFFRDKAMPDGRSTVCKPCKTKKTYAWREANKEQYNKTQREFQKKACPQRRYGTEIKRRYGCTLEQYNEMLAAQAGKCALCPTLHNPLEKKGRLFVDHCHTSSKVRKLLCSSCNSMLGYAKDNVDILLAAIEYLKQHKE